jgi:hypothetical protein
MFVLSEPLWSFIFVSTLSLLSAWAALSYKSCLGHFLMYLWLFGLNLWSWKVIPKVWHLNVLALPKHYSIAEVVLGLALESNFVRIIDAGVRDLFWIVRWSEESVEVFVLSSETYVSHNPCAGCILPHLSGKMEFWLSLFETELPDLWDTSAITFVWAL